MPPDDTALAVLADDGCPHVPADPPALTPAEKAAAFDLLAAALVRRSHCGPGWLYHAGMVGGPVRATRDEAVADMILWATKVNRRRAGL